MLKSTEVIEGFLFCLEERTILVGIAEWSRPIFVGSQLLEIQLTWIAKVGLPNEPVILKFSGMESALLEIIKKVSCKTEG